jgi:hypothetical protein
MLSSRARSVARAARLDERTATNVAAARTSVPAAVAKEAAITQLLSTVPILWIVVTGRG